MSAAGAGGQGGTSGAATGGSDVAGEAGAGGAPDGPDFVCDTFTACGCGCCGGSTPRLTCYYPEYGDDLAAIARDDRAASMSPSCDNAGCSLGQEYVCCVKPPASREGEVGATLNTSGLLVIHHEDPNRSYCRSLFLSTTPDGAASFENLELPEGYWLQYGTEFACGDTGFSRPAFGVMGSITLSAECKVDVDVTLVFGTRASEVETERVVAHDVVVDGLTCP